AFSFYYPANLELLADLGVEVKYFSPLRDKHLPENVDGLYLGGGFPEVYANYISANQSILQDIRAFHAAGKPIYAECGGFMVLTEAMTDVAGKRWPMAGLIPGETQMQQKLAALGYRVATATQDNLLVQSGEQVRGHEFHYSHWDVDASLLDSKSAWHMRRRADDSEVKPAGYIEGNLLASYLHVHMGQNPMLARRFVEQMKHG
ncbi:MAG: cobyrinic acid a,c-diamide synthase, partial [Chloroflexota bacterium]